MSSNRLLPLRSAQQGFTLIELLAALVAGSLLLATLTWTLASLGRELGVSRRAEPRQRLAAAAPVLTGLIERMFPTGKGEPETVAQPGLFVFVTAPPDALGAAGPVRASLSVRGEGDGQALYASFAPAEPAAAFPAAARGELLLAEGYRRIRFDYLMSETKEEGLPPRLVTISLTDRQGRTTKLVAAPRLTASGDCRFDPISMTCRH